MICELCFHHCDLSEGQTGFCRAGAIVHLNYGKVTSLALDPIGKKLLRRFHPGSRILSVGSFGCNLCCPFCQNHEVSMSGVGELKTIELSPEALELRPYGNIGVAYTYNEPLIGYEYVRDCAALVHERGMVNVLVTNGTIEEVPLTGVGGSEHPTAPLVPVSRQQNDRRKKLCKVCLTAFFSRCEEERGLRMSEEELRELLLTEAYVGAFSGLGAMLLDEDRIQNAGAEELEELARDS